MRNKFTVVILLGVLVLGAYFFSKDSQIRYYTLRNNTLTVDEKKFPETIGEYHFSKVDTSYGTESQRAFMIIYAKGNPPTDIISVNMGQAHSDAVAEATKNMEKYTYKNNTVSYYEGADAAYIWETDRPLNGVAFLYSNAREGDKLIHKDGSEEEFLVLDWFLKEFPIK
ncbi:MAG: hypothetical protein HYS59_02295 [Candidatus Vogelbacteria bacterium]|nr:hypothetical protein [Candidatus Vogelbacteria bacterium]